MLRSHSASSAVTFFIRRTFLLDKRDTQCYTTYDEQRFVLMNIHEGRWNLTQEDKRLWALHLFVFGMSTGFFILIPVLSYQLLCRPETDAAYVAFLNNLRCICQDLSMIPAAYAMRRVGARRGLIAAALARGLGFMLFAGQSHGVLTLAAMLTGFGGGLFFPAAMELYTFMTVPENRGRVFARREMLNSLGAVVGPLLCSVLLPRGFGRVCLCAGMLYMFCALTGWWVLPEKPVKQAGNSQRMGPVQRKGLVLFMLCCALAAVWQNQQMMVMAVYAHELSYDGTQWITLAAYTMMTMVQVPASRWAASKLGTAWTLAAATGLFVTGVAVQMFAPNVLALYAGNLLFALGMALFIPAKNSAFAALQGRVEAGMLVGIHGVLTSAGSASLGTVLGSCYGDGPGALRLSLLTGGLLLAAMLGWLSPKELHKRSGGIP